MKILIKGGRVIDPASNFDEICDLTISNGHILSLGKVPENFIPEKIIDASNYLVIPGLIDLGVRLQSEGQGDILENELKAAVKGGITSCISFPDNPLLDNKLAVENLKLKSEKINLAKVFLLGSLTKNLEGKILSEMKTLNQAGCFAFTQADLNNLDLKTLKNALNYLETFNFPLWFFPQNKSLSNGLVASGSIATKLGLADIPETAETIALYTILELIRGTNLKVHICRISSKAGVKIIRQAKNDGLNVTADVSINNLFFTDEEIKYFDTNAKLSPPLRQNKDKLALINGLINGTIDAITSDHNPINCDFKNLSFEEAKFGATGFEILLSAVLKLRSDNNNLNNFSLINILKLITENPVKIINQNNQINKNLGKISPHNIADICIVDPNKSWIINSESLISKGKNSLFINYELPAQIKYTIVNGRITYSSN